MRARVTATARDGVCFCVRTNVNEFWKFEREILNAINKSYYMNSYKTNRNEANGKKNPKLNSFRD